MATSEDELVALDFVQGDVCYALKRHDPEQGRHFKGRSPQEIKAEVLASPRLQRVMQEVATENGCGVKEVEKEAGTLLDEIGHRMALPAVRTLAVGLRAVFRRVLQGVFVNREGVERLRRAVQEWPVVLLPSHRSYLDFILVTYVMFEFNITLPCIAAGQDFMQMSIVSSFLRRSGAFFLRRTFGSDRLYKVVFSLYMQALLLSGDAPMEFFIEGTRSRTAKSLHPKLGLLSMVVEPYLSGCLPDILLLPVSISYERTLEEELFARELLGIPKPKESTRGLFKARSILSEHYGSIFMHLHSPVSLHEVCQAHGISRVPHSLFPKDVSVLLPGERQLVLKLGHIILDHTHQGMRIYPSALIAATILQSTRGIPLGDLLSRVEWLKDEVILHGGTVQWAQGENTRSVVESSLKMLSTSLEVTDDNCVKPQTGHLHSKLPRLSKHHTIQEVVKMKLEKSNYELITEIAFVHLILAHYRNQLLHLFVPEAMLALSLPGDMPCSTGVVMRRFSALHCALAREFVLPLKTTTELFSETLCTLQDRGLLQSFERKEISLNYHKEQHFLFLRNLLLPFVAGIWIVCQHLISFAGGVQPLNATIKGAQLLAAKCLHTGKVHTYETLSLDMVRNALASLTQAGLIHQPSSEVEGRDRLVKVDKQEKLEQLAEELGSILAAGTPTARL